MANDPYSFDPIMAEVLHIQEEDYYKRKLYVSGLAWETTDIELRNAFAEFGEVDRSNIVFERSTGRSRGFGFVVFKYRAGAVNALSEPRKRIGRKMTTCRLALDGRSNPAPINHWSQEKLQRKIFVGNVHRDVNLQRLVQFFSGYMEIKEGPLGMDRVTGRPKGFVMFVYKTAQSASNALEVPVKTFEGNTLFCKKAIDPRAV